MFSKLDPETLLRVYHLPESGHWNHKLTLAKRADSDGRDRTQPFGHSKITRRQRAPRPKSVRFCPRSAAILTQAVGSLWKMNRPFAIRIVRARQVRREQHLSEYEACEAAWPARRPLHSLIGISRDLVINTGNTVRNMRRSAGGGSLRASICWVSGPAESALLNCFHLPIKEHYGKED